MSFAPSRLQRSRRLGHRARRVDHVVGEDTIPSLDVADDVHDLRTFAAAAACR